MTPATFRNDQGGELRFDLAYCPVYVFWRGRLWCRQQGDPVLYRETSVATLEQLLAPAEAP